MDVSLPVYEYKDRILEIIDAEDLTIITSDTGSGKSTQICQYLYEKGYRVYITEPRRIAAISLALRVQQECPEAVVAYHTGFESTETAESNIIFCTDGLQLVRELFSTKKNSKSVLIIDELHEWNLNQETLLGWIMAEYHKGTKLGKVVVMSATIDSNELLAYCKKFNPRSAAISVPGRMFPVSFEKCLPQDKISKIVSEILNRSNILVFEPGLKEIETTISEISKKMQSYDRKFICLPLYGDLDISEQKKVFQHYPYPKVIVSTNIAQTSLTIADIDCVVDTATEKQLTYTNGVESLELVNISLADIEQRKGRAGRVKPGKYYLVEEDEWAAPVRTEYPVAEILRMPLNNVVLRLASIGLDAAELNFYHQPSSASIREAKDLLNLLGAMENDIITNIGKRMAKLPVSTRSARMLIEAEELHCVNDSIIMCAILECGQILHSKATHYPSHLWQKCQHPSDPIAEVLLYKDASIRTKDKFKDISVNTKAYFRAYDLVKKLNKVLVERELITIHNDDSTNIYDLNMVYTAGNLDRLFHREEGYSRYVEYLPVSKDYYIKMDRKTTQDHTSFVIGIPTNIHYRDKWGSDNTMRILRMCVSVDCNDLAERYPQFAESKLSDSSFEMYLDEKEDELQVLQRSYFMGFKYAEGYVLVPDHPKKAAFKMVRELDKQQWTPTYRSRSYDWSRPVTEEVSILGNLHSVEHYMGSRFLSITESMLKQYASVPITTVKTNLGNPVTFVVRDSMGNELKNQSIPQLSVMLAAANRNNFRATITKKFNSYGSTSKLPAFKKLMEELNTSHAYDEDLICYPVIRQGKNGFYLAVSEKEDNTEENVLAIRAFLNQYIMSQYPPKKFRVRINGKMELTNKCQKIQNEFYSFARDIIDCIDDASEESFNEAVDMIEQGYNEQTEPLR